MVGSVGLRRVRAGPAAGRPEVEVVARRRRSPRSPSRSGHAVVGGSETPPDPVELRPRVGPSVGAGDDHGAAGELVGVVDRRDVPCVRATIRPSHDGQRRDDHDRRQQHRQVDAEPGVATGTGTVHRAAARPCPPPAPAPIPGANSSTTNIAAASSSSAMPATFTGSTAKANMARTMDVAPTTPPRPTPGVGDLVEDRQRAEREEDEGEVRVGEEPEDAPGGADRAGPRVRRRRSRGSTVPSRTLDLGAVDVARGARRSSRRSGRSPPSSSATSAVTERPSRTASTARSTSRSRASAIASAKAAVFSVIFASRSSPCPPTGRRGADGRGGGHRGDVRGVGDEGAGRTGVGARRRDVDDDRQRCVEERLDDAPGRVDQPTRGVEPHEQRRVAGGRGPVDGLGEVVGGHGGDGPGHVGHADARRRRRRLRRGRAGPATPARARRSDRRGGPRGSPRRRTRARRRRSGRRPTGSDGTAPDTSTAGRPPTSVDRDPEATVRASSGPGGATCPLSPSRRRLVPCRRVLGQPDGRRRTRSVTRSPRCVRLVRDSRVCRTRPTRCSPTSRARYRRGVRRSMQRCIELLSTAVRRGSRRPSSSTIRPGHEGALRAKVARVEAALEPRRDADGVTAGDRPRQARPAGEAGSVVAA